jgi:hypothetical protein
MKRLSIVIFSVLVLLFISGCNNTTNGEVGQVPVYQGMTISSSSDVLSSSFNDAILTSLNFNYNQDMSIEDAINEEIDTTTSDEVQYFAARNQDVFITVQLENPDSQVILRFTLNGTIYQSYQFQEGSDSENLILKVNAGDISGIKEFTIDEIKYIENVTNETKDAVIDGNQTVKLGVTYETVPSATIDSLDIHATSISFSVNVSDEIGLIEKSGNTLKAYLYDGNDIVRTIDLVVGSNVVVFDKLAIDSEYEYAIAAVYDALDGIGKRVAILSQETIQTEKIMNISVSNQTQSTIEFILDITDTDEVGAISAIELFQGETLVEVLTDLNIREFTGLLSNNEYTIKVTYIYDLNDGVGSQTLTINQAATTLAKAAPEVVIDNVVPTQDSLTFDITVTDANEVGAITAIELYQAETLIEALTDLSVRTFTNLLSNNEYTIKVTYTYDLNDGLGEQELITRETMTTLAKATPEVVLENVIPTKYSVKFDIKVADSDNVGEIIAIELYQGETLIDALNDLNVREFTGLLSNNAYQIKVTYTYDLNDGFGYRFDFIAITISTKLINGDGSVDNPYQIETVADLNVLRQYPNLHYVLKNDIDLIGLDWVPIPYFSGVFNGEGYQIKNMNITEYYRGVGFFGSNSGVIKNVGIVDFEINILYEDHLFVGGLVGENNGTLLNTFSIGNIKADSMLSGKSMTVWLNAGGLVGSNSNAFIYDSYSSVEIVVENKYWAFVGGLTAENVGGTIYNSFSTSNIDLTSSNFYRVGNLIGEQYGLIVNSYRYVSQSIIINDSTYSGDDSSLSEVGIVTLIDLDWVINDLGWSEDLWDFSNIEQGIIVLLKS